MSSLIQCDRCKQIVKRPATPNLLKVREAKLKIDLDYDLCDTCYSSFEKWLEGA